MIIILIGALLLGVGTGLVTESIFIQNYLDLINEYVLYLLVFVVGIDLGKNIETWNKIRKMGIKIMFAPLVVIIGTFAGALVASFFVSTSVSETLAISAGFGWYSMSAVLLKKMVNTEIGTIAFLANLIRELLAILLIPFVVKTFGKFPAMAPGGATSMDTTLPFVNKYAGEDIALIGFISGLTLTFVSPFLISLLISLNI